MELDRERVIALAGNPNVGKSTVFNALTGLHQHTGNWPGKTVATARGRCSRQGRDYVLVDLPGTYSLMAHSPEEEVARDFFCFGGADGAVVVCDATCLERNLNLVLQVLELQSRTMVCVNLLDEAERKGVRVDLEELSRRLGVPVVGTCAGRGQGLDQLLDQVELVLEKPPKPLVVRYPPPVEFAVATLTPLLGRRLKGRLPARWTALRLLEGDLSLLDALSAALDWDPRADGPVWDAVTEARQELAHEGLDPAELNGVLVAALLDAAREAARAAVTASRRPEEDRDRRLDRFLTRRTTAVPLMILLLAAVLWLTIQGRTIPPPCCLPACSGSRTGSATCLPGWGPRNGSTGPWCWGCTGCWPGLSASCCPLWPFFSPCLPCWRISVTCPGWPFMLDHAFQKARACGKQALTMCMGFGCNAAGVVGCRIIDSPRERLIAMLTNSFVPCNGRFPTLIAVITMFFVGAEEGPWAGLLAALLLTGVILLGVLATFLVSRLLSATVLKGVPSSFTLELPPYRKPRVGQVIVRSILDRTIFVLGRAAAVAAPAGLVIWLCANVTVGEVSVLDHIHRLSGPPWPPHRPGRGDFSGLPPGVSRQ